MEMATTNDQAIIADWLKTNPVRRFETGASGTDYMKIQELLEWGGYEYEWHGSKHYLKVPGDHRRRKVQRITVMRAVDEVRRRFGLEPIIPPGR